MGGSNKDTFAIDINKYYEANKMAFTGVRFSLVKLCDGCSDELKGLKSFLENEVEVWKNNKNLKELFATARRKLENSLKDKFDDGLFRTIYNKYIDISIKNIEKKVNVI